MRYSIAGIVNQEASRRRKRWLRSQKQECSYCRCNLERQKKGSFARPDDVATVDHATPLSRGGKDVEENFRVCCQNCNKKKARMTESEYKAILAEVKP